MLPSLLDYASIIENERSIGQLTEQGYREQREIAERIYHDFPELFSMSNEKKPIVLQSTHKKRTKDSLMAFLGRLEELDPSILERREIVFGEDHHCDPLLRFFDGCVALRRYVKDHPWKPAIEQAVFNASAKQQIKKIMERIFAKEFVGELEERVQIKLARSFYHLCQLDANLDKHDIENGFCSVFVNDDEMAPFVWEEDASDFFSKGFAGEDNVITQNAACVLLGDFVQSTQRAIAETNTAPVGNFRFGHSETMIPFVVHLGLFRKDSIEDMLNRPTEREFRTSEISPMSANIQWILYKCPAEQYRARMRHNETDVAFPIPGCSDASSCAWETVKNFYEREGRACDATVWEKQICKETNMAAIDSDERKLKFP